jgi:hypothetical protein
MSLEIIQAAGNHYDIGYTVGRAEMTLRYTLEPSED